MHKGLKLRHLPYWTNQKIIYKDNICYRMIKFIKLSRRKYSSSWLRIKECWFLADLKLFLISQNIIFCEVKEDFLRITFPIHERMIDHRFRGCSGLSGMTDLRLRLGDSPSPFCAASAFIWTNLFISTKNFFFFAQNKISLILKAKIVKKISTP